MITVLFSFGNEKILIMIDNDKVEFASTSSGAKKTSIEGLQLSQEGVIKEFPDLKDKYDWREQAIIRFNEKKKSFNTEQEIADYIIKDLTKYGYIPEQIQKGGSRPKKI